MDKESSLRPPPMPRLRAGNRLKAASIDRLPPGMHADGNSLYARIGPGQARSWVYRYRDGARLVDLSLGSMRLVTLADARTRAAMLTGQRIQGIDPGAARRGARVVKRQTAEAEQKKNIRFAKVFEDYLADNAAAWSSDKHADNWRQQLTRHALPVVGHMPVSKIDIDAVLRVLRPIWTTIPETAGRVRLRLEKILDYARVKGFRTGDNPARLAGNLALVLPSHGRLARVEHFAALPWRDVPAFFAELAAIDLVTARALRFLILSAVRTSDALGATWGEIDFGAAVWVIPAARMKSRRPHRVPLSAPSLAILGDMARLSNQGDGPVFPNPARTFYSNVALLSLLKRMERRDFTVHGFRSSFRDWVSEATDFRPEIAEAALAHAVSDATVAAYARSDFFERRRALMDAWAAFVTGAP